MDIMDFLSGIIYCCNSKSFGNGNKLCNLIKGDLANESPTLKSETMNFYKAAEDNINSNETFCKSGLEKCIEDTSTMAIDVLNFPKKYKDLCNYKSYSRSLFACKNRQNWPKTVGNELPLEYINCRTDCLVDEKQPYNLSNGKTLFDYKFRSQRITTNDIKFSGSKLINAPRNITQTITAFDEAADGLTWTSPDSCPPNSWANFHDTYYEENTIFNVTLLNLVFYCSNLDEKNNHVDILQTYPDNAKQKNWNLTTYNHTCATSLIPLRGISLKKQIIGKDSVISHNILEYCKDSKPGVPGPGFLDCPNSDAICSVQAKNLPDEGEDFRPINIRIGCCDLQPKISPSTTTPSPITSTTSSPNTTDQFTLDNIYKLQKREFYFYGEVIFNHITRYNRYYSPYSVINETEWITTKCPPGTYVKGVNLSNPNSEYYVWRRIMELNFHCGSSQGGQSTELNIYSQLRNKFGLKDSNIKISSECSKGYLTSLQLEYSTEKSRSALVHGWKLSIGCSISGKNEEHNNEINYSSAANVLSETVIEKANDDCGMNHAICGFTARLSDERMGSFEGFLIKTICCKI